MSLKKGLYQQKFKPDVISHEKSVLKIRLVLLAIFHMSRSGLINNKNASRIDRLNLHITVPGGSSCVFKIFSKIKTKHIYIKK